MDVSFRGVAKVSGGTEIFYRVQCVKISIGIFAYEYAKVYK